MVDSHQNQSSMNGTRQGIGLDNDTVLTLIMTGSVNGNEKYMADAGLFDPSSRETDMVSTVTKVNNTQNRKANMIEKNG